MAAGTVGYNLNHVQVAAVNVSPVYSDVPGAIGFDPTIDQNSDKLRGDGASLETAYGAAEGSGSMEWAYATPAVMAIMTGGTASTSGTGGTLIDRLEIKGNTNPPAVILVGWIPNISSKTYADSAGIRVTLPNAKVSVPSFATGQETFTTVTADLNFDSDSNGNIMIIEWPKTAPTFTLGVIPTNLTPPA